MHRRCTEYVQKMSRMNTMSLSARYSRTDWWNKNMDDKYIDYIRMIILATVTISLNSRNIP
jgi:hypothetical protein